MTSIYLVAIIIMVVHIYMSSANIKKKITTIIICTSIYFQKVMHRPRFFILCVANVNHHLIDNQVISAISILID
jgi:hypothetical protein